MRERFQIVRQQLVEGWPYYGPRVIGAVVILLLLVGGYTVWRNLPKVGEPTPNQLGLSLTPTPTPLGESEQPKATISLGGTPTATPTPTAVTSNLPKTGFPVVLAIPVLLLALGGGLKLSSFKKN
ncbi:MAG: hypothetical protein HYU80_01645 [Candidatus Blackburnbacteria bacterium]|nr:hypothetical protein [Candidatus Blackburnbacteria bacterium]